MFVLSGNCAIGFSFMLLLRLSTVLGFPRSLLVSVNSLIVQLWGVSIPSPSGSGWLQAQSRGKLWGMI